MEKIEVEVKINQDMLVSIYVDDIIDGINSMPVSKRWNYIAKILNAIDERVEPLNKFQKELVKKYLTEKLELFSKPLPHDTEI